MLNIPLFPQFKVGIIGLGRFGRLITAVLKKMPNIELVAVCELKQERLQEIAREFEITHYYADLRKMLDEHRLDAVFIATNEDSHVEPVLQALRSGSHVFVEKPLAQSLGNIDQIKKTADEVGHQVMVGHLLRFDPRLVNLKLRVDSGELGSLVSIYARRSVTPSLFEMYQRCHPWLMLALHDLDAAFWLLSDTPETIYAVKRHVWARKYADAHWALIQMRGGAVVLVESTSCVPGLALNPLDYYSEIVGTHGTAVVSEGDGSYHLYSDTIHEAPNFIYNFELPDHVIFGALRDEIEYFITCIATGSPIQRGTIEQARLAVSAALAAIQSEETEQIVHFDQPDCWQDIALLSKQETLS